MMPHRRIALLFFFLSALVTGRAASTESEWPDGKGGMFRGEPVEAIGPLLTFRTGATSGRSLPMRFFSPAECVRFYQAVAGRPGRANRWSEATGDASREFMGKLQWFDQWRGESRPFDFPGVPEPEFFIVLFGGPRLGLLLDDLVPFTNRLQRVYPGRVATIVVRQQTNRSGPDFGAVGLPSFHPAWLVTDPGKQNALKIVKRAAPTEPTGDFSIALMTRQGIPLLRGPLNHVGDVIAFTDGARDLLWRLSLENPGSLHDRTHYLRAVRPVEFAQTKCDPLLIIDPFKVDFLRLHGVVGVKAKLEVGTDGSVAQVELQPDSEIPTPLAGLFAETLRSTAVILPAIDHGRPVAGTLHYTLNVAPLDSRHAADSAWITGEARIDLPLKRWLVLKPIRVSERVFSATDRVAPDGTVLLKPVTAGRSDRIPELARASAFYSDWFADEGATSVRPVAGEKQEVDGGEFVWSPMNAVNGFVDLLGSASYRSQDFCIGYAWTEFESPADMDAWLGIGSDDGLKVWLNDDLVSDKWATRRSRLDDDVVPLRLKKGRNQLLIKVQNHTRDWSFTCRLRVRGSRE